MRLDIRLEQVENELRHIYVALKELNQDVQVDFVTHPRLADRASVVMHYAKLIHKIVYQEK